MKHLEKLKTPIGEVDKPAGKTRKSGWKMLALGLVFVLGVGYGLTLLWDPVSKDALSNEEKSELVTSFSKLTTVQVVRVSGAEMETALDSMRLAPHHRQALKAELTDPTDTLHPVVGKHDSRSLVWINLWDFASPDGDVVSIASAGYKVDVLLHKNHTKIAVPVDAIGIVKITGVRDGGGGITLAIQSDATGVSLPVLQVGETMALPLSY